MSAGYPTLNEILRLSTSEPINWLIGASDEARPVRWVVSSADEAGPGDILLLPVSRLNSEVIQYATAQGVAALLLVGDCESLRLDPEGDLAIASIPESAGDVREIQRMILTVLVNQRAALIERGVRIHAQLSQLEAEGRGLFGLAKAMQEISGKGVMIQDKRGHILAEHPSSTLVTIWEDVLKQMSNLESLPEFLTDRKRVAIHAAVHHQIVPGGLERLVTPIVVGEMARGYLSLVGLEGEFDELDRLVLDQGGMVSAIEMARNKAIRETEKRLKGDLLTALLQGELSSRDATLWVQQMGLDLTQAHAALRFVWDGSGSPSRRRLETLVNGEVARLGMQVIVSPMGSEFVCFCQVSPGSKRPEQALALGRAVIAQAAREYAQNPCRCGVGSSVLTLEGWRTSLREAGQALELARRLGKETPLYFPDLSVYRLLFQLEHSPEIITFQEETLGRLLEHEGADELIHTLETYFEHNGNLSQAAEALFVHRNTLIYRIERIESITNLNLDNPEERLAMQLALRIYRMLGSKSE
jgi:PucR family transcriptional regulator, purine catabolism regulatory protein